MESPHSDKQLFKVAFVLACVIFKARYNTLLSFIT